VKLLRSGDHVKTKVSTTLSPATVMRLHVNNTRKLKVKCGLGGGELCPHWRATFFPLHLHFDNMALYSSAELTKMHFFGDWEAKFYFYRLHLLCNLIC